MGNQLVELYPDALVIIEALPHLAEQLDYHARVAALKAYWKDNDVAKAELEAEAALADTLDEALARGDVKAVKKGTSYVYRLSSLESGDSDIPPAVADRWRSVRDAGRKPPKKMTDAQRRRWEDGGIQLRRGYYAWATSNKKRITREGLLRHLAPPDANPGPPTGSYEVIVIDPPWPMKKIDRAERPNQTDFDYQTMDEEALGGIAIPAADDCHLWCWTTHKFLPMAIRLVERWQFKYVCTFVWHKPGGPQPFGLPQYMSCGRVAASLAGRNIRALPSLMSGSPTTAKPFAQSSVNDPPN